MAIYNKSLNQPNCVHLIDYSYFTPNSICSMSLGNFLTYTIETNIIYFYNLTSSTNFTQQIYENRTIINFSTFNDTLILLAKPNNQTNDQPNILYLVYCLYLGQNSFTNKTFEILDEYSGPFPFNPSLLYYGANGSNFLMIGGFNGAVGFFNFNGNIMELNTTTLKSYYTLNCKN